MQFPKDHVTWDLIQNIFLAYFYLHQPSFNFSLHTHPTQSIEQLVLSAPKLFLCFLTDLLGYGKPTLHCKSLWYHIPVPYSHDHIFNLGFPDAINELICVYLTTLKVYQRPNWAFRLQIPSPEHSANNKADIQASPRFDGLN